ncbi:MAG TPA: exosortase/archaeosortase family protein [Methylomirabilota bacterium]|nr:exosortase/archaeosortase family protein [Methylomirabilota bacterium]
MSAAALQNNPPDRSPGPLAEALAVWRQWPDRSAFLCLFAAWVALFHFFGNSTLGYVNTRSLFGWWGWVATRGAATDLRGEVDWTRILDAEEAHMWLVPFAVVGLLWYRRADLLALPKAVWWPAGLVLLAGTLLHLAGYAIQQQRVSVVAFFVGLYGLTGLVWGWPWMRATVFPFSLFAFCVPLGSAAEPITFPLRLLATELTGGLCKTGLGINVIQEGTQLFSPAGHYQYEVAAACGGIRSLTAILAFSVVYGYLAFRTNWRRLLVAAAAFPLAVVGNVFRLTLIVVASEAFGREAGNFVHENWFFSLAPYVPSLGGTLLLGHWLREDRGPKGEPETVVLTEGEQEAGRG